MYIWQADDNGDCTNWPFCKLKAENHIRRWFPISESWLLPSCRLALKPFNILYRHVYNYSGVSQLLLDAQSPLSLREQLHVHVHSSALLTLLLNSRSTRWLVPTDVHVPAIPCTCARIKSRPVPCRSMASCCFTAASYTYTCSYSCEVHKEKQACLVAFAGLDV